MPDLHWTIPVARWSSWPAAVSAAPEIGFIEPIVRRRLSTLSRVALKVAHDCVAVDAVRVVFASRHGELRRTTDILRAISAGESVSPTAFSLSVLNAMTGVFGIARNDRSAASAISAGAETLGYALLEAHAQHATQPDSPLLLIYADEPADPAYGTIEDEVPGGAIAILLESGSAAGELTCVVSRAEMREFVQAMEPASSDAGAAQRESAPVMSDSSKPSKSSTSSKSSDLNESSDLHDLSDLSDLKPVEALAPTRFATQSQALQHCLETGLPAAWQGAGATWHWSWHDRAA